MNPTKAIYCRTVQAVLRAALPVLPYREPEIFRSCAELSVVFSQKHIQRVLIVTDEGIAAQLEAALERCNVAYTVYSETRPNPTIDNVEAALWLYHRDNCQALIAIPTTAGTGSETTLAAVITDSGKKHKYVMNDFVLIPRYAVLDASLTRSLPPHLTSTTAKFPFISRINWAAAIKQSLRTSAGMH